MKASAACFNLEVAGCSLEAGNMTDLRFVLVDCCISSFHCSPRSVHPASILTTVSDWAHSTLFDAQAFHGEDGLGCRRVLVGSASEVGVVLVDSLVEV